MNIWSKVSLVLAVVVMCVGCARVQPVYNVSDDVVPTLSNKSLTVEQVGNVIAKAAVENGWTVKNAGPGILRCTSNWHTHSATVEIVYTNAKYSINLVASENLKQADGMIHRKYNQKIQKLESSINNKLALASN